jgi:hypothetical protein
MHGRLLADVSCLAEGWIEREKNRREWGEGGGMTLSGFFLFNSMKSLLSPNSPN